MHAVPVTTAEQSAARDAAAIQAGVSSLSLMVQAGTEAAAHIVRIASARLALGVDVLAGRGNNGGDGYIVAVQLARLGVTVRVHVVGPPATVDAQRAAALARERLPASAFVEWPVVPTYEASPVSNTYDASPVSHTSSFPRGVLVDAMLGTGVRGALREPVLSAARSCRAVQAAGALVVALDLPSGVDANTGALAEHHVIADHTVMFGTPKLGVLGARGVCGELTVVDIGLGAHVTQPDGAATLAHPATLRILMPIVPWNAHKGERGRVLLVGGAHGMAGAIRLAADGALVSGAGLVRACVHPSSVLALQAGAPAVVCDAWPTQVNDWPQTIAIGPGLGRSDASAAELNAVLEAVAGTQASLVLDADAITLLAMHGVSPAFARCASSRPVVLTPHAGEYTALARALDVPTATSDPESRLAACRALAATLHCVVLLKGTPTVCAAPSGTAWIVPRGSAALATGGTGDVLTGILAAQLALQTAQRAGRDSSERGIAQALEEAAVAAATAAWVHGVAGEAVPVRGFTVRDLVRRVSMSWRQVAEAEVHPPGVLARIPRSTT